VRPARTRVDRDGGSDGTRRKLLEFARRAEAMPNKSDQKLLEAIKEIKKLLLAL
jgi:hypothetical protein